MNYPYKSCSNSLLSELTAVFVHLKASIKEVLKSYHFNTVARFCPLALGSTRGGGGEPTGGTRAEPGSSVPLPQGSGGQMGIAPALGTSEAVFYSGSALLSQGRQHQ